MARNYLSGVLSTQVTSQSEPIPGSAQVPNSAGGYAFAVDDFTRLRRWLVLGSEGGSYYASEQKLTKENAEAVLRCIQADGKRTVEEIVAISDAGRAPKNDPALYALAMCAGLGDLQTKKAAYQALPKVARISTHLMHFVAFAEQFRRWGRLARAGVAGWYEGRSIKSLAEQAVKYQSRDGWAHADLIRLAHPVPTSEARAAVYRYMSYGAEPDSDKRGTKAKVYLPYERFKGIVDAEQDLAILRGFEEVKQATDERQVVGLIERYGLQREMVPTQWLDSPLVWASLLPNLGITAIIRNLAKLTSIGLIGPGSVTATQYVIEHITNQEILKRGRVHPIAILLALMTYKLGHGIKGSLKWEPVTRVIDALDKAFYLSFGNVEPSNVAWEMWLDVSGSMDGGNVAGIPGFTPRDASAAFALVNANVESQCEFYAFTTTKGATFFGRESDLEGVRKVNISSRQRLDDVLKTSKELAQFMAGTDCALPMLHALKAKRYVDTFCVLTDSETWAGSIHPAQALRQYRREINPKAKLIVVGMVSNGFSIADPKDGGMLDVTGFDAAAPAVMSDFAAGRI
jgi:60 kDa SS-A/Ro ribonucleoprotein